MMTRIMLLTCIKSLDGRWECIKGVELKDTINDLPLFSMHFFYDKTLIIADRTPNIRINSIMTSLILFHFFHLLTLYLWLKFSNRIQLLAYPDLISVQFNVY